MQASTLRFKLGMWFSFIKKAVRKIIRTAFIWINKSLFFINFFVAVNRTASKFFLYPEQLVVFSHTVGTAH